MSDWCGKPHYHRTSARDPSEHTDVPCQKSGNMIRYIVVQEAFYIQYTYILHCTHRVTLQSILDNARYIHEWKAPAPPVTIIRS